MAEYIDRAKIGLTDFEIIMCDGDYREALKMLVQKIQDTPTADVQPVVCCRDCKYNKGIKTWIDNDLTADCTNGHGYPPLDWFCADGEKGEES